MTSNKYSYRGEKKECIVCLVCKQRTIKRILATLPWPFKLIACIRKYQDSFGHNNQSVLGSIYLNQYSLLEVFFL